MAYASWLTPSPTSGSGDSTVSVSASAYTGRVARTTTMTFHASGVSPDPTVTVSQTGKTEFVTIDSAAAVAKENQTTVTIHGKSNSDILTFSLGSSPTLSVTLPSTYTAAGMTTTNGTAIGSGTGQNPDPGANQEFDFDITLTGIEDNTSISPLTAQLIVTPNHGSSATCTITQAAGDAYLNVSPLTITLAADGSQTGTATVTSNTSWTVV